MEGKRGDFTDREMIPEAIVISELRLGSAIENEHQT